MLSTQRRGLLLTLGLVLLLVLLLIMASSCGTPRPEPIVTEEVVTPTVEVTPTRTPRPPMPTPIPVQVKQYLKDTRFFAPQLPDGIPLQPFIQYAKDYFIVTGYERRVDCAVDSVLNVIPSNAPSLEPDSFDPAKAAEVRATFTQCLTDSITISNAAQHAKELLGLELHGQLDLWYVKDLLENENPKTCGSLPDFEGDSDDRLIMNLYYIEQPDVPGASGVSIVSDIVELLRSLWPHAAPDLVYATGNIEGMPYIGEGGGNDTPESVAAETGSPEALFDTQWAFGEQGDNGIGLVATTGNTLIDGGTGVRVGVFDTSPFHAAGAPPVPSELSDRLMPVPAPTLPAHSFATASTSATRTLEHHGLFVASLINKVAPGSDILLYQVLNDDGMGDLFTLTAALHTFILDKMQNAPFPEAAVMNLSLGSPVESEPLMQDWIYSLKTLIAAAHCNNIVVVTSAGNYPGVPQTPAVLAETIAVKASNRNGGQACYCSPVSGKSITAPGGDGGGSPTQCKPILHDCEGDCEYALIGMVLDGNGQVSYDYWNGTSFAAPLVSGLSALLLEQENGRLSPDDVFEWIEGCAVSPGNIIDVPSTLSGPCLAPKP